MKNTILIFLAAALALVIGGCLVTGQNTILRRFDVGLTTNTTISGVEVDLNEEEDYRDNKDKIKSVDEISVVAIIVNELDEPAKATLYLSNDESLNSVEKIRTNATLVFVSPEIPAKGKLRIGWADGFRHVKNEKVIIKEVLGDGKFFIYTIAENVPFSLDVKAEIAVTITVGK